VKVDGAWHLHEATRGLDLRMFVLYSSVAGVLGSAGQGAYAAANAFLDRLAEQRHACGLAATSIAWGLWTDATGMTSHLGQTDVARIRRGGVLGLPTEQGLALFDVACVGDRPAVVAARLDETVWQAPGRPGTQSARPIAGDDVVRESAAGGLRERLRTARDTERRTMLTDVISRYVAQVLGHSDVDDLGPDLRDAGLDSLSAMELRNLIDQAAGIRLPLPAIFESHNVADLVNAVLASSSWTPTAETEGRPPSRLTAVSTRQ
jgi:acyl carrier protein